MSDEQLPSGLVLPEIGSYGWGEKLNANFRLISAWMGGPRPVLRLPKKAKKTMPVEVAEAIAAYLVCLDRLKTWSDTHK